MRPPQTEQTVRAGVVLRGSYVGVRGSAAQSARCPGTSPSCAYRLFKQMPIVTGGGFSLLGPALG